jgi:hypothetical protein
MLSEKVGDSARKILVGVQSQAQELMGCGWASKETGAAPGPAMLALDGRLVQSRQLVVLSEEVGNFAREILVVVQFNLKRG